MIRDAHKKTKVMLFTCSLDVGGTQRNVINIAKFLDKSRFDCSICCLFSGGDLAKRARHIGISIREMRLISGADPLFYHKMVKLLREQEIDILHCFGYPAIYYSTLATGFVAVPTVITTIQDWDVWKQWPHRFLDRIVRGRADLTISDGEGARRFAREQMGIPEERIVTIYDGVDLEELRPSADLPEKREELGIPPDKPIITVIARLDDAKKGQSDFLRAAAIVHKKRSDARFLLVGGGEDEDTLKDLAARLGIEDNVVFTGMRNDLADMIGIADIIAIPSRWESVPKILLEAMALSKPVIATAVGDIAEILIDGKTGILVPPRQPEVLARAILHLLENNSLSREFGRRGRERILEGGLLVESSVRKLEETYEHLHAPYEDEGRRDKPHPPTPMRPHSFLLGLIILYISNLFFALRVNLRKLLFRSGA